jgi:hypothetical protein
MKNKILLAVLAIALVFGMTACSNGSGGSSNSGSDVGTFLNGTWKKTASLGFKLDSNNWIYFEDGDDVYKGTWTCSVKPATGISGATLTLTVTHIKQGSSWGSFPSEYNSVKTNTAKLAIPDETHMNMTDPALTTEGVWAELAGTYTKQ